MDPIRTIKLRWVFGVPGDINYQLSRFRFSPRTQHIWQPAINAYRCDKSVRICVDLAGVRRLDIELAVETKRVIIRGARDPFPSSMKKILVDVPEEAKQKLKFIPVENVDEVLNAALEKNGAAVAPPPSAAP
jgi:HSP20 family molecular chaperone IbpA